MNFIFLFLRENQLGDKLVKAKEYLDGCIYVMTQGGNIWGLNIYYITPREGIYGDKCTCNVT
jgi:hypothetical protein